MNAGLLLAAALGSAPVAAWAPQPLVLDALGDAAQPSVAWDATRQRAVLTWQARLGEGCVALRVATLPVGGEPEGIREIAHGCDWFVNWADFPALAVADNGDWVAHWLQKTPGGGYRIRLVRSRDGGRQWSAPITPHDDAPAAEHGFVSMAPAGGDAVHVAWLDGGAGGAAHGAGHDHDAAMALRTGRLTRAGWQADAPLDARVCSCCATDLGRDGTGDTWLLFRDRSPTEVRDIGLAQFRDGRWSSGPLLHADGWTIAGCPVNGPALATRGGKPVAAWSTMATDTVLSVRYQPVPAGPMQVLERGAGVLGRTDAAPLGEGVVVVWLGGGPDAASVRLRAAWMDAADRRRADAVLATLPAGRAIGMPRAAGGGEAVLVAWTEAAPGAGAGGAAAPRLRAAWLRPPR